MMPGTEAGFTPVDTGATGGAGMGDAMLWGGAISTVGGMGLNLAGDLIGSRRQVNLMKNIAERERRRRMMIAAEDEKLIGGMEKANPAAVSAAAKQGSIGAALGASDPGMGVLAGTDAALLARARSQVSPQIVIGGIKEGEQTASQRLMEGLAERGAKLRELDENAAMEASLDPMRAMNAQSEGDMLHWGGSMAMQGGESLLAQGLTYGNRNTGRKPGQTKGKPSTAPAATAASGGFGSAIYSDPRAASYRVFRPGVASPYLQQNAEF